MRRIDKFVGDNIADKLEFIRLEHVRTDLVNPGVGVNRRGK